jgi:cytochrome b
MNERTTVEMEMKPRQVVVWDPLVRIGHWIIVAAFTIAYFTEDEFLSAHVWAGYVVGLVVAIRAVWGFVGPKHARFADFLFGPSTVVSYLVELLRFRTKRYIGHSPGGGMMIFALLACLTATVVTGLAVYGAEKKAGPLRALYAEGTSVSLPSVAIAKVRADKNGEDREHGAAREKSAMKEFHKRLANITLGLVIIHIVAVLWASIAHRENLVWAMVTGRKRSV